MKRVGRMKDLAPDHTYCVVCRVSHHPDDVKRGLDGKNICADCGNVLVLNPNNGARHE